MATTVVYDSKTNINTITGLTASESSDPVGGFGVRAYAGIVEVTGGGGTNFNSGTVTIQGSLDKSDWHTLKDPQGNDITFTADGFAEITSGMNFFRATADGSINDVDVRFKV